jgi:hypothetical protein
MRASEIEGRPLQGPDGAALGTVTKLLLEPSGAPVVVGASVRPPAALVVVERPETYVPLSALSVSGGVVSSGLAKLPKVRASAASLGHNPDETVIWSGMPLAGPSGSRFGIVSDFDFDPVTGAVGEVLAHESATANAAYGYLSVPADDVIGYADGAVRVRLEAPQLEASGGLAKAAAAAAVGAAGSVAAAGDVVTDVVVKAGSAAGRAIKAVKDSEIVEKTARSVGGTWRDTMKAFKDGMNDDE